jgi:putative FmdB family regulatory protein
MPLYDYQCNACRNIWEARHGFNAPRPDCPACGSDDTQKIITQAPTVASGVLTPAGTSRRSSKEELRDKWREETPKLRQKLEKKLGRETVQRNAPHLYNSNND